VSRFDQLKRENDELRRDKHELVEHLELASANIQRLSLANYQLRQHLEAAAKVARIVTVTDPELDLGRTSSLVGPIGHCST
jgi:hypothetical protein